MAFDPLEDLPVTNEPATASAPNRALIVILGVILALPAMLCCIGTLLIPTIQTVSFSLQKISILSAKNSYVGLANYTDLFQAPIFSPALVFTAALAAERFAVVAIVPLMLALALNEFGRIVRIPARLLFSIPLALFAPVLLFISWRLAFSPLDGLFGGGPQLLGNPANARSTLLTIDALQTFGLACGLGLIVYLIALRGTGPSAPTWKRVRLPLFVVWLITVFAAIAYAIQTFDLPFTLTQGGPANSTTNLSMYQYQLGFRAFNFGPASTIATLTLIVLALLGLFAGIVAVAVGLRMETVPWNKPTGLVRGQNKVAVGIFLALGIAAALAICAYGVLPVFWTWMKGVQADPSSLSSLGDSIQPGQVLSNTILPAFAAILIVQLPVTYFAAMGIGALRPLGKYSEWLLLLFSPWLFTSIEPLAMATFLNVRNAKLLDTVSAAQIAPATLNVIMLFILTFYFKGQSRKWRESGERLDFNSFARVVILPSLPLALFLAGIGIVTTQQDLFWPLLVLNSAANRTIPPAVVVLSTQFFTRNGPIAALIAYFGVQLFVVTIVVLAVFQIFFVDRLALGAGKEAPQDESMPEVVAPQGDNELLDSLLG